MAASPLPARMLTLALGFPALAFLSGCGTPLSGSGNVVTREVPVGECHRLEVSGMVDTIIRQGPEASVTWHADDVIEWARTLEDGETLRLGVASNGVFLVNATLRAEVDVSPHGRIDASASGSAEIRYGAEANPGEIRTSGVAGIGPR